MLCFQIRSLRRDTISFARSSDGSIAPLFALAAIPLMAALGASLDYSRASQVRESLQTALDSAVLVGAADTNADRDTLALNTFNANFAPKNSNITATPSFTTGSNGVYSGSATASVPTTLLRVMLVNTISVSAQSTAQAPSGTGARCIIALNASAQSAINDSASSAINAPDCFVQVNSDNGKAVTLSGSAKIDAAQNCFVGGHTTSGSAKVTPVPLPSCAPMADPFANMPLPSVGACKYSNYKPQNNERLQPGVYCGGLDISSVTVTFAPGLYIIKDGLLQPSGGSQMSGNGVSFFLTGKNAGVNTSGGSSWHVSAMTTGDLAGFVFFLDPNATPASSSTLSGTSELYFEGVLYFARQQLNLSGGSATYAVAPFTAYIADTFVISGSSNLNINSDATKANVPVPSALLTGGKLRLIM